MDTGKSWGHLIVVLLIWNQSLAAVSCKICCSLHADTVRGGESYGLAEFLG